MVWDGADTTKPMSAQDWEFLGHEYCQDGRPTLPRRRLDIPLPPNVDGLHLIAMRLSNLTEQLHMVAREGAAVRNNRVAISQAKALLEHSRRMFKALGQEWEAQLREAEEAASQDEPLAISHRASVAE